MRTGTMLRLRELAREQDYEAELSRCAGVTGFHRWFFLRALAEALGMRFRAVAVDDDDGEPLGAVPLLLRRRGPVSTVNYLPVPHVGPVLRDARLGEVLRAVDPYLLRQRAVVTKWSFAPGVVVDTEQLTRRGFQVSLDENFVVPANRTPRQHLDALSVNHRREISRGQRRGMEAGPSTRSEIVEWFPARVIAPYQRQGIRPDYSPGAARRLAERLAADPRMVWRSVRIGERVLAVNALIAGDERAWAWIAVADRVRGPSPQVISYWDAIEWSLSRGLACDFAGAPTPGIRERKIRMGCEVEHCVTAERVRPRAYRVLRTLHARSSANFSRPSTRSSSSFWTVSVPGCGV